MTLHRRLHSLEDQLGKPAESPNLETIVAECRRLDAWLADRGLTAEEALARRERGPSGLRYATIAGIVEARRELEEWRRERFDHTPRDTDRSEHVENATDSPGK